MIHKSDWKQQRAKVNVMSYMSSMYYSITISTTTTRKHSESVNLHQCWLVESSLGEISLSCNLTSAVIT